MKLQQNIVHYIEKNKESILNGYPDFVRESRQQAIQRFFDKGFPSKRDEKWRKTSLTEFLNRNYHPNISGIITSHSGNDNYCMIPDPEIKTASIVNGYFTGKNKLNVYENGVIMGSLKAAFHHYPGIVKKYFNRLAAKQNHPFDNLNTILFTDGLFLYVPGGIKDFKLQLSHKLDAKIDALVNVRNLIVIENDSRVDIIHCDDSNAHRSHFATFVSEIFIDENAMLNLYKYQNINDHTALFSNSYYKIDSSGSLYTGIFELNGKLLRNEQNIDITGKDVNVDLYGLYLTDKNQQADNLVYVSHSSPQSHSNQKFKGIIDDSGRAFFNGHILVKQDAQQTKAYQKNDNILLTDKARISSQPFLEIYADDVSCSHGSTTGQIDKEALFYIRQRGISKKDAQLLQLYAFAGEIIDTIKLPALVEPTKDLVKKRLNGELDACEDCILQCAVKKDDKDEIL